MTLSNDLVQQFVKVTQVDDTEKTASTAYGKIIVSGDKKYVQLDGSDLLTPIETTTPIQNGDRVLVTIDNHTATVTGNLTNLPASSVEVTNIGSKIDEFEIIMADKVTADQIEIVYGYIENLTGISAKYEDLSATTADLETLKAKYANLEYISATDMNAITAEIETIKNKFLLSTQITTDDLNAVTANINDLTAYNATFTYVSADKLKALKAEINQLSVDKLDAASAEIKYANIDFANINMAAVEKLFTESGIIKDIVVEDGSITGELVGVTIKGDLIEGNTVVADKLVIKGEDGLFYKLNVDALGEATASSDEKYQNQLDGSVIVAKSITADRISVSDLVAFGATIGGFNITTNSIYSGVKSSIDNTTRGIYMDNDGQFAVGDSSNYLKYFYDEDSKTYKLAISAGVITMGGTSKTVEETINEINEEMEKVKDNITTNLRIESSRGTVFKNNSTSTVLSVVIYRAADRITDIESLRATMGSGAYLQWKWRRIDDDDYGIISSSDKRISDDGFTFTLNPDDIDTQVTFMCELIN
jgi:hypothetical protein